MLVRNDGSYSTLDDDPAGNSAERTSRDVGVTSGGASSLRSFWLIVRWRAWLIAAVTVATVVLVVGVLAVIPPRYKATTVVLVDPRQPRVTTTEVLSGIGADAAAVESQVELIELSALAKKVIARLKLAEDPDFTSTSMIERVGEGLLALLGRTPANSDEKRLNRLIYKFQSGLTVRRRGLTYVLEISYAASNPAKAA